MNAIIQAIRKVLPPADVADLDSQLAKLADPGEKYQAAFAFLGLRRQPQFRDRIIQVATLAAYGGVKKDASQSTDISQPALAAYEADVDQWKLPRGVEALGRIWTGIPKALRGPIITTNFDPLCEIAIAKGGEYASARVMDADGSFMTDYRVSENPQVIHIHGYWRESSTLSMTSQLTQPRPALNGSLRSLLSRYSLLVIGYGAWKDAVTSQILEIIREQSARELDILWTSYSDAATFEQARESSDVLNGLMQAPGNVQFYAGIDANQLLPRLENELSSFLEFSDEIRVQSRVASLVGWKEVPTAATPPRPNDPAVNRASALSFFDGRLPNWDDARSASVPVRDLTSTVINQLKSAISRRQSTLTILTGASGEGKSTAVMQVAARTADTKIQDLTILFNSDGRVDSPSPILALPADRDYLLIIDDAFRCCETVRQLVIAINEGARARVHIVVCSRDTDWSGVGGFSFAWSRYIPTRQLRMRGVSRIDAVAVVKAWESIGPAALGELSNERTTEDRITKLIGAAGEARPSEEGTFFGALLTTRYGEGLREHIRELLTRLMDRPIHLLGGNSRDTLADSFFLLAVPHSVGVKTMTKSVLAEALDMSEAELFGCVILALEDEAAVSYNTESLLIRHRMIASVAVDLAPELGIDVARVCERVVVAAVRQIERNGAAPNILPLAYLSQSLTDPALQLVAAQAAVDSDPRRISYRTSLSRAYRHNSDAASAVRIGEGSAAIIIGAPDAFTGLRPMLTEWCVAEGNLGHWARNAVLAAMSLEDLDGASQLSSDRISHSVNCLVVALRRLWDSQRASRYLAGLAGIATLGMAAGGEDIGGGRGKEAKDYAFRNGARSPGSLEQAALSLEEACRQAESSLESPLPHSLPTRGFRFNQLMGLGR